jgi:hypothetical protein
MLYLGNVSLKLLKTSSHQDLPTSDIIEQALVMTYVCYALSPFLFSFRLNVLKVPVREIRQCLHDEKTATSHNPIYI